MAWAIHQFADIICQYWPFCRYTRFSVYVLCYAPILKLFFKAKKNAWTSDLKWCNYVSLLCYVITNQWSVYYSLHWCLELFLLKCRTSCLHYTHTHSHTYIFGLGNIKKYLYWDLRLYIILDINYRYIVIRKKWCFFLILKAALQWSEVIFSTYKSVLLVLILALTYLVNISTLLMIIDQKWSCVNIFRKYQ